jgi:hypothetical protein
MFLSYTLPKCSVAKRPSSSPKDTLPYPDHDPQTPFLPLIPVSHRLGQHRQAGNHLLASLDHDLPERDEYGLGELPAAVGVRHGLDLRDRQRLAGQEAGGELDGPEAAPVLEGHHRLERGQGGGVQEPPIAAFSYRAVRAQLHNRCPVGEPFRFCFWPKQALASGLRQNDCLPLFVVN